jgi:poly-gamma-glutamate capsule biosynthesis protein CapA/YwtB (metallophosphatase superfamily)
MLGRGVAAALEARSPDALFSEEVLAITNAADAFVLNLECCISTGGRPWPDPNKPFFFRAPPQAVEALHLLGVHCVTLGNNHALDFGYDALLDTFEALEAAAIPWVGAGRDLESARAAATVHMPNVDVVVVGATDHPADYAASIDRPGVALADFRRGVPGWLADSVGANSSNVVLVTPHWGPNMTTEPPRYVRAAAEALIDRGATVIAGHSAHVFHGVDPPVLYDLGDFLDDYAVDPVLRNDLGLLWLVHFQGRRPVGVEAVPLKLDYCHTRLADGDAARWIESRFTAACRTFGVDVSTVEGRMRIDFPQPA